MPKMRPVILAVLIAALLSSCSLPMRPATFVTPAPAATIPYPAAATGGTPAAEKAFPTPVLPNPSPTTPTSGPACLPAQEQPVLAQGSYADLPENILRFLNSGGTPDALDTALVDAGFGNQPQAATGGDLTGDGKPDLVASIYDPASLNIPPAGALIIYTCQGNGYEKTFQLDSLENFGAPSIRFLQDLNADNQADLVTSQAVCGATTCFESVQILSWTRTRFVNRLTGSTDDLPYPDIQLRDAGGKGIFDLVILGGSIGSAGAGPQRGRTRTWEYDPASKVWAVAADVLEPSDYRIHVLQDAGATLQRGEIDTALVVYEWVRSDSPPLEDFLDPKTEKQNLGAYAAYMLAIIRAGRGEEEKAQAVIAGMEKAYPKGTPQHAYVEMAAAYRDALAKGDATAACEAVKAYASSHEEQILTPLGQQTFGYANKDFIPEDMCP